MKIDKPQITVHIEIINETHIKTTTKANPKISRKVEVLTNEFINQLETVLKELDKPTLTKKKK